VNETTDDETATEAAFKQFSRDLDREVLFDTEDENLETWPLTKKGS
jgi:hypothetical protein